jgi:hypothetical protein
MSQVPTTPAAAALPTASLAGKPALAGLPAAELLPVARQRQLLLGFLLLGLVARCVRFFLRFPLWEDECFLCVNFTERGYLDLLQPLQYHQVAPPLFLWIELSLVRLLGFTELALRAFPFLCSVVSLFLFRRLAGRLLRGLPLLLAVAIFAVAYPCIRYAAEAKQYASDQLVSLVLLTVLVEWWRRPTDGRLLGAMIAFVPVALALSYPAVFVAGAVSLVMAAILWSAGKRRDWLRWAAYNVVVAGSFGVVFLTAARTQGEAERDFMGSYWQSAFPPVAAPAELPRWLLVTHTGDLLAYPIGGGHGGSTLTFLGVASGLAFLLWRRRWLLLLLAVAPFALHLTAAALQRYPYGGHFKFSQHLAPLICMLAGLGSAAWVGALAARPRLGRALLAVCVLLPLLVGVGTVLRDLAHPYKTQSDQRARAFAQWFWFSAEHEGEAVCLHTDLGHDFSSRAYQELSWAAMYLCNQKIYSPRHAAGAPPCLDHLSAERPLRCLLYRDPEYPCDEAALGRWLGDVQTGFQLVSRDVYAFPRYDKREHTLVKLDHLEIIHLIPRPAADPTRDEDRAAAALAPRPPPAARRGGP